MYKEVHTQRHGDYFFVNFKLHSIHVHFGLDLVETFTVLQILLTRTLKSESGLCYVSNPLQNEILRCKTFKDIWRHVILISQTHPHIMTSHATYVSLRKSRKCTTWEKLSPSVITPRLQQRNL